MLSRTAADLPADQWNGIRRTTSVGGGTRAPFHIWNTEGCSSTFWWIHRYLLIHYVRAIAGVLLSHPISGQLLHIQYCIRDKGETTSELVTACNSRQYNWIPLGNAVPVGVSLSWQIISIQPARGADLVQERLLPLATAHLHCYLTFYCHCFRCSFRICVDWDGATQSSFGSTTERLVAEFLVGRNLVEGDLREYPHPPK